MNFVVVEGVVLDKGGVVAAGERLSAYARVLLYNRQRVNARWFRFHRRRINFAYERMRSMPTVFFFVLCKDCVKGVKRYMGRRAFGVFNVPMNGQDVNLFHAIFTRRVRRLIVKIRVIFMLFLFVSVRLAEGSVVTCPELSKDFPTLGIFLSIHVSHVIRVNFCVEQWDSFLVGRALGCVEIMVILLRGMGRAEIAVTRRGVSWLLDSHAGKGVVIPIVISFAFVRGGVVIRDWGGANQVLNDLVRGNGHADLIFVGRTYDGSRFR